MNSVLIITYYWPPSGGAGVQRWLKFTKYLRDYGWEPVIYTPENPEAPATDESLLKEVPENIKVIKKKIWEPYQLYKKFIGQSKEEKVNAGFLSEKEKPGLAEKLSVWIRGNLFIPDARKYWIKPSIRFLSPYLKENPVDAMISTGPPHSMHMIALGLKKKLNIPWLADFRDPWTQIDFYDQLNLTRFADKKHHRLEKQVLGNADKIVTVSKTCASGLEDIAKRPVKVITNGFDQNDFENLNVGDSEYFEIVHIGSINKDRNAIAFWQAISELIKEQEDIASKLKIILIGKIDFSAKKSISEHKLDDFVEYIPYLPHKEAIRQGSSASILLLPLNNTPNAKGILTGKLFEYLALRKPILCIGPTDSDIATIVKETQSGSIFHFTDKAGIKSFLLNKYLKFKEGYSLTLNNAYQKYNRKNLTKELSRHLEEIKNGF